ncbi:MAG TPA: M13 family metallopeptidase [Candidatus Cottocaccamicrobium excrementipullorum]|nr:M13 family metallopeptidase [Candidatus Cottocaccamicrobium excrementipullorum]
MKKQFHRKTLNKAVLSLLLCLSVTVTACGVGGDKGSGQTQEEQIESQAAASAGQSDGTQNAEQAADQSTEAQKVSEKDDYYQAVNGALIDSWEIEPDKSSKSWFGILNDQVEERMAELIKSVSEETDLEQGSDESNIRALYLTGLDQTGRNEGGFGESLSAFFDQVDAAESIDQLMRVSMQFCRDYGIYSLFGISIGSDYEDSSVKTLVANAGDPGLSKEIWFSEDEANQKAVSLFEELLRKLCVIQGYSETEAEEVTDNTVQIMKSLAEKSLSQSEFYDPEKTYNVYTVSELEELFGGKISSEMIQEIYGVNGEDPVIVSEVELARQMASFLTEENLPMLKGYVKLCAHRDLGAYMDMDSYDALNTYNMEASGMEESRPFEEVLISDVQGLLGFQCGRMYCEQNYSEETTAEVKEIISQVISVFHQRIDELDWMSDATKAEAKNKLGKIDVRVGHPDDWPQDKYELNLKAPEDGGLYIDNFLMMAKVATDYNFATIDEPVDKSLWPDTPQTVNAYYDPQSNSINILAGILQAPFYDPDASVEENLGGIGTVIGHEITHAFDTNGALFDEKGNLRDWWTAQDKEQFQALADQVISYYDGMDIEGKKINGEQTVTENIADLGGVSCITEIADSQGYDLKKVYEAYANIWASKEREEYLSRQVAIDIHSPAQIRVNAVLSAQQEFRDLYDIEEGDGMYQEEMPGIW